MIAVDGAFERAVAGAGDPIVYLWAPDDAAAPASPPREVIAAARGNPRGIATAVARGPAGERRRVEAVAVDLPRWRGCFRDVAGALRRRYGLARDGGVVVEPPLEGGGGAADSWSGGWRYDLTHDGFDALQPARVPLGTVDAPRPWRGAGWADEVRLLWPTLPPTPPVAR